MGFSVVVGKDTILLVGGKCNGRNSAFFYFLFFLIFYQIFSGSD